MVHPSRMGMLARAPLARATCIPPTEACALRGPELFVFDPTYGPPEAPPEEGGLVLGAGGAFDVFSTGLLLVQMCFPAYRDKDGMKRFRKDLKDYDYDLRAWRASVEESASFADGFEILDRSGGFALLEGCLRRNPWRRISSSAAAASRFCLFA